MKLILIYPNLGGKNGRDFSPKGKMEPLALAVIAALTPPDVDIFFYDDRIEDIPYDKPADLVGISVETFSAKRSYQISREYRKRGVTVVLGGFHPTNAVDEALMHADCVVKGEAEGVWPGLIEDFKNDQLKKLYEHPGPDLSGIFADRSIFSGKKYRETSLVFYSRGCTNGCNFCALSSFYTPRYNTRPIDDVVREIRGLNSRLIFIVDDNIAINKKASIELFRKLTPLKKNWVSSISINHLLDESLVKLMANSGCKGLLVGIESLNSKSVKDMGKDCNAVETYFEAISNLKKYGIMYWGSFLFGYHEESKEDFDNALNFAIGTKSCLASFNPLTPYPGTALYNRMIQENRVRQNWWLEEDYQFGDVPFNPGYMGADELARLCISTRRKYTSLNSIFRRAMDFRANLRHLENALFFLAANFVSRIDGRNKEKMILGRNDGKRK